tara:strand:- start:542 stop:724 length:183 start_codon:yes stop_codon:yes gene_type:complete
LLAVVLEQEVILTDLRVVAEVQEDIEQVLVLECLTHQLQLQLVLVEQTQVMELEQVVVIQ